MLTIQPLVILLDVDNTLLDNDAFMVSLGNRLRHDFGAQGHDAYWAEYHALRAGLGYADYLGALQRFRIRRETEPRVLNLSSFLLDYPFAERLYPRALDVMAHLRTQGLTALLSDGDAVFQPRKVQRSGLWDAVGGRVMITLHKERMRDAIVRRFPGRQYLMVDDKPHLLTAMKAAFGERLTTVFVRQGHYALGIEPEALDPPPDHSVKRIAELMRFDSRWLVTAKHLPPGALAPRAQVTLRMPGKESGTSRSHEH
jgi:FMN phosphatase YigB (HAD superfamily)